MDAVSVLILNYMSYRETLGYIANLKQQKGIQLSILVVDNHSPNESFEALRRHFRNDEQVSVIQSGFNGGYAYGNNFGLRYLQRTNPDFILISNNDIYLDDLRLIADMVKEYRQLPNIAFLAPSMYVGGKEDQKHQAWKLPRLRDSLIASLRITYALAERLQWANRYYFSEKDKNTRPVDCLSGSFFIGAGPVFYHLGMFDENTFLYMEEAIIGHKVKEHSLQNYLMRGRRFRHAHGKTSRSLHSQAQLQWQWLRSAIYYHRHYQGASVAAVSLLLAFYPFWVVETLLLRFFRRLQFATFRHDTP